MVCVKAVKGLLRERDLEGNYAGSGVQVQKELLGQ